MPNPLDIFSTVGNAVGSLVSSVFSGIDSISTSEEEKQELKVRLLSAEAQFRMEMSRLSVEIDKERAAIIKAEIASNSWLARSWRPIIMLAFAFVVLYGAIGPAFGAPTIDMNGVPDRFWSLLTIGVGGYIAGRSAEKIIPETKWSKEEK
jgi:hypothetical protein